MWHEFLVAFCLMLVLEGVVPFLYPGRWRSLVVALAQIDNNKLRMIGLASMIVGTLLLYLIN
jgi:uncharacterized protein YjeT (DUF2065 family)